MKFLVASLLASISKNGKAAAPTAGEQRAVLEHGTASSMAPQAAWRCKRWLGAWLSLVPDAPLLFRRAAPSGIERGRHLSRPWLGRLSIGKSMLLFRLYRRPGGQVSRGPGVHVNRHLALLRLGFLKIARKEFQKFRRISGRVSKLLTMVTLAI